MPIRREIKGGFIGFKEGEYIMNKKQYDIILTFDKSITGVDLNKEEYDSICGAIYNKRGIEIICGGKSVMINPEHVIMIMEK